MNFRLALLVTCVACSSAPPERDQATTTFQIELLNRASKDQSVRDTAFSRSGDLDPAALAEMRAVGTDNADWLRSQVRIHGWPSAKKVGRGAEAAAMLIVLHATHDPAFQVEALDSANAAFERREVDGPGYAGFYDGIMVQTGRPQKYGTQARRIRGVLQFDPIDDSAGVNGRRSAIGLPSLEDFRRVLDSANAVKQVK